MPSIEELLKKSGEKKFIKTSYRPYDYDIKHRDGQIKLNGNFELENLSDNDSVEHKSDGREKQETLDVTNTVTKEDKLVKKNLIKEEVISIELDADSNDFSLRLSDSILKKREIQNLVGIQKKIFFSVFNTCVKEGALCTVSYTTKNLEEMTETSVGTVKSALNRLFKKNLLLRLAGRRSKGGYLYLGFDKEVWDICMKMVNEDRTLVK